METAKRMFLWFMVAMTTISIIFAGIVVIGICLGLIIHGLTGQWILFWLEDGGRVFELLLGSIANATIWLFLTVKGGDEFLLD